MLGVPTGWRTLDRDSIEDEALHGVLAGAAVISPWTVGRYREPKQAQRHAERNWKPDMEWCRAKGIDYLPVVFPGFSWHNMHPDSPLDKIPRLKGEFLRSQFIAAKEAGASMIYVAMFDEMDEATAIFKCTNDPPVGEEPFPDVRGIAERSLPQADGLGRPPPAGRGECDEFVAIQRTLTIPRIAFAFAVSISLSSGFAANRGLKP